MATTTLETLQAQVEALTQALQAQQAGLNTPTSGRSPVLGPLTNLLHPRPSATVPKPNFFYEGMDLPYVPGKPFPTLRYRLTDTGVEERCCRNAAEVTALGPEWVQVPPSVDLPSPLESLEEAMASLSGEERTLVLEEQRKVRLSAIQAQLASLSPDDLAAIQSGVIAPRNKGGRPRKVQ